MTLAPSDVTVGSAQLESGIAEPARRIPRTLVVTAHFPPRHGGVQRFTSEPLARLSPDDVAVLARGGAGSDRLDAQLAYRVDRFRGHATSRPDFARLVRRTVADGGYDAVWFTSGMPLAAAAAAARRGGARRVVVSTHGLEAGWAGIPAVRPIIRRGSAAADVVTVLGDHFRERISAALDPAVRVAALPGGVDCDRFHPGVPGAPVRAHYGLADRRLVVTVGRLVPRKGQALLLRAWPAVLRRHPDAVAMLIGEGKLGPSLRRLAADLGITRNVVFAGAVPDDALPAHLAAADIYVLPCRTMMGGMAVEGLGLTTLEASASGLPVLVGDSGGARDALIDGATGYLLDTRPTNSVAAAELSDRINHLLDHPAEAARMGQRGRAWVAQRWTWQRMTDRLCELLTS